MTNQIKNVTASSEKAPDKAQTILSIFLGHLQDMNPKDFVQISEDNKNITFTAKTMTMVLPLEEVPKYAENYLVENADPKGTVYFNNLIRYTLSQLIPGIARDGKLGDLKDLGFCLNRDLTQTEKDILAGNDEQEKNILIEKLLVEGYDPTHTSEVGQVTFRLTDNGVVDCKSISRGNVRVSHEDYVSNVLASEDDGRSANLRAASKAYAASKGYTKSQVEKWMKENGYTWHEIDDKAIIQKVPTHLHSCIRHAGGVALVSDKYDCYNRDLQLETASRALIIANGNLEEDKEKLNSAKTQQQKEAAESQIKETEERIAYLCSLVGNGTPSGTDSRDVGDGNAFNVC